jgi:VanZ family protein
LTEYIQTFVPGRYGAWKDVWLDFSGYISSTILVFVFLCIIYLIIHFKNNKTRINK